MTDLVGRSVKERSAFLWRPKQVERLDDGPFYPDPQDRFIRAPFWEGRFGPVLLVSP